LPLDDGSDGGRFPELERSNRYLPNRDAMGKDHALPNVYRSNNYPKDKDGQGLLRGRRQLVPRPSTHRVTTAFRLPVA